MANVLLLGDASATEGFVHALRNSGHQVVVAHDPDAAFARLREEPIDVVVSDLTLPRGVGLELVRRSRRAPGPPDVVVITAQNSAEPALEAFREGACDYLMKPVHGALLAHAVERTLAQRSLAETNELLRQYVALADAARRIATARDRIQLFANAYAALPAVTGAKHVLVYLRSEEHCSLQLGHMIDDRTLPLLAKHFADELHPITSLQGPREVESPLPELRAFIYPAQHEGSPLRCFVVCLYDHVPKEEAHSSACYLGRNLALGAEHLERATTSRELAYRDHLTSLFNTRYLQHILEVQVKISEQKKEPFSLLFLDLDHFKSINDAHGHAIGSLCLVELARLLKGCVRDTDTVVRYGGDEFVALLPKCETSGAALVAERIRRRVSEHSFLAREGKHLRFTTCIGIACYPEHTMDTARLLELADQAMYLGKNDERGLVHVAPGAAPRAFP